MTPNLRYPGRLNTMKAQGDGVGEEVFLACNATCLDECLHETSTIACHSNCIKLKPTGDALFGLIRALASQFNPPRAYDEVRKKWLSDKLAANLKLPFFLPPELRIRTAQGLVQEYSTALTSSLPFTDEPLPYNVGVYEDIWATYVEIDGIKYVSALTSQRHSALSANAQLLPSSTEPVQRIHICEDHLGIRKLVFSATDEYPVADPIPGVWWKTMPVPTRRSGLVTRLRLDTDGMKGCTVTFIQGNHRQSSARPTSWPVPKMPQNLRWHQPYEDHQLNPPAKMTSFRFSQNNMTGFSACGFPQTMGIYAHTPDNDVEFYEARPSFSVWLYTPLDADEFISEIWARRNSNSTLLSNLAVKTNKGRVCYMGHHVPYLFVEGVSIWQLMDTSDGGHGQFYFDGPSSGFRRIAFGGDPPLQPGVGPSIPQPISEPPPGDRLLDFYSSAPLKDVTELMPCRMEVRGAMHITGILLRYSNGHLERLGHVRPPCLEQPLVVGDHSGFSLGFSHPKLKQPFVAAIALGGPLENGADEWLDLSWDGTLEWWFTAFQCDIQYKGKRFPAPLPGNDVIT
ncbi:hypothetical protein B0T10DRAFT_143411 [Thelonectria olida]|uniref:Uncharacterized protein n=1 Tax=Thelonectria olida TaxID=1576542 RepID=A0A9P8VVR6_9HYPO|nr:hypothetical protein B0T10DRAFT_143411 [Thelonectria olida]